MVGRRAVLQGAVGAVAGGVPAMRPDQALQPVSRSGTGPAPQNAFLVNPIIVVTPGKGLFIYSPSPGAGNLIASVAASAGTDPYGNPYPQGITSYGSTIEGIFNASTLSWQALSNPFNVQPSINGNGNSITGADLALDSGAATSSTAVAAMDLEDAVRSGTGVSLISMRAGQVNVGPVAAAPPATATQLEVQGTTALKNATAPASVAGFAEPFALGGNLAVVNGLAGDGQTYDTQVLHVRTYPAQTISLNSFSNVTGASVLVGAAHYTFVCRILYTTAAAAGATQFQFTSPATTGSISMMGDWFPTGGGAPTNVSRNTTGSLSLAAGATLNGAGGGGNVTLQGDVTFSASGTLQLQAQTSIAGDNYVIAAVYLDLYPVN